MLHSYKFYVLLLSGLVTINSALFITLVFMLEAHVSKIRHAIMTKLITHFRNIDKRSNTSVLYRIINYVVVINFRIAI